MRTDRVRVDAHARPRCTAADGGPDRETSRACVSLRTGTARTLFRLSDMQPDRVQPPKTEQSPAPPRRRFTEALRARVPRPAGRPPVPRRPAAATLGAAGLADAWRVASSASVLRGQARVEMDASAQRRIADGAAASDQASARLDGRATELLRAALRTEVLTRSEPPSSPRAALPPAREAGSAGRSSPAEGVASVTGATGAAAPPSIPEQRIERAMALVERIERFVRSGRPALALTLNGDLAGRLELQRVAPGAISIRLSSARPPSSDALGELRQALEARGLSVRSLETRSVTASAADACSPCP